MKPDIKTKNRRLLFGLQVGIRQLLLATLCTGLWFAHWTNQFVNPRLELRLSNLQSQWPQLIVSDPNKIAVVRLPSLSYGSTRWGVYVTTEKVRICIATEDIAKSGFPDKYEGVLLPKGRNVIQLDKTMETGGFRLLVTQNGKYCFNIKKKLVAGTGGGSGGFETDVWHQTRRFDDNIPILLTRSRSYHSVSNPRWPNTIWVSTGSFEGLILWLQSDR